jgi:integrase
MGSVYRRGRIWWYNFEFRGKRYQGSTRLRNQRLAERFVYKLRADLALGLVGLATWKPGPPLKKYADQFRGFIAIHNKEHPRTIDFYEEKLERLLEFPLLANARISDIDEKLIETYVQYRNRKVGPASINRELATLRRALRVAWKTHKLISSVPTFPHLDGEGEREFVLSQDQEKAYLAAADDTLRDFAILSLDTGMRAGEAASLEWPDVHLQPAPGSRLGYIAIRKGKTKNAKRILSITPRVKATLQNRRRFLPKERFVFPGRRKETHVRVTSIDHLHETARGKVRFEDGSTLPREFVIHSLRHTFGTRLGESSPDADAFTIMKVMGHSTIVVSQKYVHPTPDRMERAFEQLDAMNEILRGEGEAERKLGVATKIATAERSR